MKRIFWGGIALIFGISLGLSSCQKDETAFEGKATIRLEAKNGTVLSPEQGELELEVTSSIAPGEDATLHLETEPLGQATAGMIEIPPSIVLRKGEKTATLVVKSGPENQWREDCELTIRCTRAQGIDADLSKASLNIAISAQTPEQRIKQLGWNEKLGLNLGIFIGQLEVDVTMRFPAKDGIHYGAEGKQTLEFKTHGQISIPEDASAEEISLDMPTNAMGLTKVLRSALEYSIFGHEDPLESYPEVYKPVSEAIGWNAESEETFEVALRGIRIHSPSEIDFIRKSQHPINGGVNIVDFEYHYSAYDRLMAELEVNSELKALLFDQEGNRLSWGGTPDPGVYLIYSPITEDDWGTGMWIEPSATIDEGKKTLTFRFCIDTQLSSDYTQVEVTYHGR